MAAHQVRALLMGGQACVFYGAAEFSRDTDLAILAESDNWRRLNAALAELQAECIAVPPSGLEHLRRGFALHFRCQHPDATGMRVDLMSVMRGVAPFPELWERRTALTDADGTVYELLSLPDLVRAKKTQRDKDWPMLRRLVDNDYLQHRAQPDDARVRFWLLELRTPEFLLELAKLQPGVAAALVVERPLLARAQSRKHAELALAMQAEQELEREKDRVYWQPLKAELEKMRHLK